MQCNIDARGKMVRLIGGLLCLVLAAVLAILAVAGAIHTPWVWLAVAAAGAGGAFQVFEARAGWCALRAMGWRTPV